MFQCFLSATAVKKKLISWKKCSSIGCVSWRQNSIFLHYYQNDKEKYVKQPLMYDTVRHSLWVMLMVHSPLTPAPTAGISVIECRLWGLGVKFKWVTQSSEFNFHFKQAPRRCMTHIYSYQPQHRTNICWLIPVVLTVFLGKDGDISVMLPSNVGWHLPQETYIEKGDFKHTNYTNWRSNSNFSVEKTNVSTCHYCPFK